MRRSQRDEAIDLIRSAGRALGDVRELDVMDDVLARQEEHVPAASAVVAVARRTLRQRRADARRALIKRLERLDLDRLNDIGASAGRFLSLRLRLTNGTWTRQVRNRIAARAADLREATHHATGVYFPKRLHAVRIAAKKLRYAVEVADDTGFWRPPRLLKDLRRIQATLGEIHDAQVLIDTVERLVGKSPARVDLPLLTDALQGEIARYHPEYLARRDRVLAICAACERFARVRRRSVVRRPLVAATLVAVPTLLLVGQRRGGSLPQTLSA